MFFPVETWFAAFVLTIAVETPVVIFLLRAVERDLVRHALICIIANLATHPVVWFVITQLLLVGTLAYVVVAEGWAIVGEAVVYAVAIRSLSWRRAAAVSLAANAASFIAGRVVGTLAPELFR